MRLAWRERPVSGHPLLLAAAFLLCLLLAGGGLVLYALREGVVSDVNFQPVIQWFELGGELKIAELSSTEDRYRRLANSKDLLAHVNRLGVADAKNHAAASAAAEMILEGLWAHRRIGRSEERGFFADTPKQPEPRETPPRAPRRGYN